MTEINKITVDLINIEIQLPEDKIIVDKKEYDKVDRYILSQEVEKDSVRKEISLIGICFDKEKGKNISIGDNIYIVARPKINEFNRKKKYKS